MIKKYLDKNPRIDKSSFIEDSAIIIGDVEIGAESSVWFNTIIRGNVNYIRIGNRTNIQDGSVCHVTLNKFPLTIGSNVTVGHGAILHGCILEDFTLIGMGAKILDGARVEAYSMVAAGALVKQGFVVPSGYLVAGVPQKLSGYSAMKKRQRLKFQRTIT